MRTAVYVLVFVNLAFFAWAAWIDAPPAAPAAQSISRLPQLALASDAQAKTKSTVLAAAAPAGNQPAQRCVSVGPFNTLDRVQSAAALLRDRGFEPKQREEDGETWDGYWVYVGGLKTTADESRVMRILEQAELYDARVMPQTEAGRRISVGLFSERIRAERRVRVLKRLGLTPEIGERRLPGTVYWVDLNLGPNDNAVPTDGLVSLEEAGSRLEVRVCPAPANAP